MNDFTTGKHVLGAPAMGVIDHGKKTDDKKVQNDGERQSDSGSDKAKATDAGGTSV